MIGSIIRLDDEDKEKNPNDMRNAPDVVEKALFDARVVMLTGEVNDVVARRVTERLFALSAQNAQPITFVISSPGGHVESGDMIHDTMRLSQNSVRDAISQSTPVGRIGTADDIAQLALYLASDASGFVTATVVLTFGYLLSRGIAKASRVLEQ